MGAPRSLLSLGDMLDEYICLKEQKVILNQDKSRLDHEKSKILKLLYVVVSANFPVYHTPVMMSASRPSISISQNVTYSTPMTTTSQMGPKKRKNSKDVSSAPSLASKRSRAQPSTTKMITQPSGASNTQQITPVPSTSPVLAPPKPSPLQGSSVAKCLFNPAPQTPSPSTTDKSVSPADNQTPPSMNKKTVSPQQHFTSTNRTVITSETIQVSPMKQVSYYSIERNHCISSPMKPTTSKRFSTAKGRLDFDGSEMTASDVAVSDVPTSDVPASDVPTSDIPTSDENTTGSPSEDDAFDFDLPNLDCLADFNLTDLLGDFDDGEGLNYFNGSSPETLSGSPDTVADGSIIGDHELISGMSSTVTEIRSEQDMNAPAGPNSVTSMRSVTKCIKVFSPVKSRKSTGSGYETCDADQQSSCNTLTLA
ncbi:hypothetical protein CTI12_AA057520 [Artemisia annua]|uniref:Uncharacterized protein n=1 Tax=Artemisia annua TaxID=35608 RepID=A0A2U1PSZ8_ARTAN|nr:hypothetical protein CTI12_AA057520 [Artemisia annua]